MQRIGNWAIGLNASYASRVESGDLVFWKGGRTVFAAAWGCRDIDASNREHLERLLRGASPARRTMIDEEDGPLLRHAGLLREPEEEGGHRWALYAWTIAGPESLQLGICFDLKRDLTWATAVVRSVSFGSDARDVEDEVSPGGYSALASARVVGPDREPVLYAYGEAPDHPSDSGWRFFAGDESDAFVNDPDNVLVCSLTRLLAIDPSLRDLVVDQDGGAWERSTADAPWRPSGL